MVWTNTKDLRTYTPKNAVNTKHTLSQRTFEELFSKNISQIKPHCKEAKMVYFTTPTLKWNYVFVYPRKATGKNQKIFVYSETDSVLKREIILCDTIDLKDHRQLWSKIEEKKKQIKAEEKKFIEPEVVCFPFTSFFFRYKNPKSFDTWRPQFGNIKKLIVWLFKKKKAQIPSKDQLKQDIPVQTPDFVKDPKAYKENNTEKAVFTWLGHASVLATMSGINVLTDPLFSARASPFPRIAGPKRYVDAPCTIENLPEIHVVLISHSHYDHCDTSAIKRLNKHSPNAIWFVPKRMDGLLRSCGIRNIKDMSWGDSVGKKYTLPNNIEREIEVVCVPAQHWGCRTGIDIFRDLWCGWVISVKGKGSLQLSTKTLFFSGDTGMCRKEFLKIGMFFDIDLALLPIGCYEPSEFMYPQHISPKEAVVIHQLVGAKKSMAIHWGTYDMGSSEDFLQPRTDLRKERKDLNVKDSEFLVANPGETHAF